MEPVDFYHDCLHRLNPKAKSHWSAIANAYRDRAYHNLDHLREMLGHYQKLPPELQIGDGDQGINLPAYFGLSLIYHDIIYVAGKNNNEARSADLLEQHLRRIETTGLALSFCRRLIMATKTHQPSAENSGTEALLIDLDLAVLARPTAGYDAYTKAVREEFRRYPDFLYKPGRRKALRHFLEQPTIYHTPHFREQWESLARANVARELEGLGWF